MKQTARILSILSLSILLMLLATSTTPASLAQSKPEQKMAQAPPAPQMLSITVVRVRPDMLTEYQDFVKNETIPMLQKAGMKERDAWTTAVFGEGYEYVYVTAISSWADYDGPAPAVKALGQDGARAYGIKARKLITSSHTYAAQARPDLSYMGKMTWPPKMIVVNSISIAPGRNQSFENIIKNDILPALKKAEVAGYFVSQTIHGGDASEYITLTAVDSFAEIGKGSPLVRGMGGQEEFNKYLPKVAGIIVHQERSIMRYVPELSFTATAKAENK
jgi:hypothetical protein